LFLLPHFFNIQNRAKILKPELRQWKCIMIVALWQKQVFTYEILPAGQTVNNEVYLNFLERLVLPEVNKKKFGRPIILHDNATPHKHRVIREFLQEHRWEELEHPSFSADMSPPDMDGIMRIKAPNKGKQYLTQEELINDYIAVIQDINQKQESKGITMLPDRWSSIAIAQGKYLE